MVVLAPTRTVDEEFECEMFDPKEKQNGFMVRPCERYKELLNNCTSIKNRLHQYYVYGELLDCEIYKQHFKNCLKYRDTKDMSKLDSIIEWESNLIALRMKTVTQNKAWTMREGPPSDFNKPLPEFLAKRQEGSLFYKVDEEFSRRKN